MLGIGTSLESTLQQWSKPASDTEEAKCENALRMIKKAIGNSEALSKFNIKFIPQGSYHNNTNVRLNSDVDIAVKLTDTFYANYPEGTTRNDFGNSESSYTFNEYRNSIEEALINTFGAESITFGDKSIKIRSNTYRVDADVVPCFEHRRYDKSGSYIAGTEFRTRFANNQVINFPEQHYENGVGKNIITARKYKRIVRILKRLRNRMKEEGYDVENIPSFLIECLVWNVPNQYFNTGTYTDDLKGSLVYLIQNTSTFELCKEWGEVSELLYLFRSKYDHSEVNKFLREAYEFVF
ncbi:nucleotidyltransferase [Bacillus sp. RO1]|uniref:nucleotidyltransferase domain-containing protein n=1 Tax=Bacillus sp. RO1 TaxID=2722703 RepID=UPI0014571434|nr:nucleotidyltransferase [Bacillus sp. RO1]NLP50250.1 nucleotidyltransferase [Bacillus sp. RO1]